MKATYDNTVCKITMVTDVAVDGYIIRDMSLHVLPTKQDSFSDVFMWNEVDMVKSLLRQRFDKYELHVQPIIIDVYSENNPLDIGVCSCDYWETVSYSGCEIQLFATWESLRSELDEQYPNWRNIH